MEQGKHTMSTKGTSADSARSDSSGVRYQSPTTQGAVITQQVPGLLDLGAPSACHEYSQG